MSLPRSLDAQRFFDGAVLWSFLACFCFFDVFSACPGSFWGHFRALWQAFGPLLQASWASLRDFGVFLADPDFHLRHLFHGVGEFLFHLDAVELASDLTVLYDLGEAPLHLDAVELSVCGVFFADPSFFLRYLLHGLGEMGLLRYLHHGLGEIGEIPLHHDGVELARDLIVALTSDCFL